MMNDSSSKRVTDELIRCVWNGSSNVFVEMALSGSSVSDLWVDLG